MVSLCACFFVNDTATTEIYTYWHTRSLHDALPISPDVRANYLASPPLVVAYALFGTTARDITKEPIGTGKDGQPVYLKDIWPTNQEVQDLIHSSIDSGMFRARYDNVYQGDEKWQAIKVTG